MPRKIPKRKYYVTMTDKFMSGWGLSQGKTNKLVVGTKNYSQALRIKRNAKKRSEMKYINITSRKPSYNKKRYLTSYKPYKKLGKVWKEK